MGNSLNKAAAASTSEQPKSKPPAKDDSRPAAAEVSVRAASPVAAGRGGRKTPPGLKFMMEEPAPTDKAYVPRPSTAPARPTSGGGDVAPNPDLTFPMSARVGCGRRPRPSLNLAIPADAHHNVTKILDFMLVGGDDISTNLVILREHNVKTIVNATTDGAEEFAAGSGILYVKLNWKDEAEQPILGDLQRAFDTIEEARTRGGVCLVHCKSGMSRSGSIAIAYLVHHQHMTLLEALTFCRNKRPIISPNPGFMSQLVQYEQEQRGSVSVDVIKYEENRFGDTSVVCAA